MQEGFSFTDSQLNSTIGDFDGNVYEKIYRTARMSPLNQPEVMVGWKHLSTAVDLDFIREGKADQRQGETAPPREGGSPRPGPPHRPLQKDDDDAAEGRRRAAGDARDGVGGDGAATPAPEQPRRR